MRSVAVLAGGCVVVILNEQLAMLAALELLADLFVTRRAIHFSRDGFAGTHARGVDLGVALAARDLGVGRTSYFLNLNEHGAAVAALQVLIRVAAHAVRVRHSLRVKHLPDLVGLVAVDAGWKNVRFLLP